MFASHDVFRLDGMTIDLFAGLVIGTKSRAFEGNSGKHSAGTRIAEDLGSHPGISICGSIASFGASGNRSIRAQLHLAAEDGFHAAVIHDQQDQVRRLPADLEADTAAFQRVHGWGSPWATEVLARPANHRAASVACTYAKC